MFDTIKNSIRPFSGYAQSMLAGAGVAMVASGLYTEEQALALIGGAMAFGSSFWMLVDKFVAKSSNKPIENDEES